MMKKMNCENWQLIGTWPLEWKKYVWPQPQSELIQHACKIDEEKFAEVAVTPWINAQVPGSIHNDLKNNGLIEEPYYEMNSIQCEWVHSRAWIYKVQFSVPGEFRGKRLKLIFKGVDYFSYYFLNGIYLGMHEGMFTSAVFNVDNIIRMDEPNTLYVVIEKAPEEVAQMGETRKSMYQKSRFGYKWDFGTKLVNMGIWDDVLMEGTLNSSIDDIYIRSDFKDNGSVGLSVKIKVLSETCGNIKLHYRINTEEDKSGETIENTVFLNCNVGENEFEISENIEKLELWWPNGYGKQNLYTFHAKLYEENEVSDEKSIKFGLRNLSFIHNENSPPGLLPYTAVINGRRIFIRGWNWVPMDHMYGSVGSDEYEWFIKLAANANVNLLRIWGGGLIEKEIFYDLCDKYGILVWQEFIQSSSNRSSETNKDEEFLKLLYKTSREAIIRKRNHPCLAIWCGGNELIYDEGYIPQDYNDKNTEKTC